MKGSKGTLIVLYRSLSVGGIENYVIRVIRNALKSGKRVIWICNIGCIYSPIYRDVIEDPCLEIEEINFSGLNIYKLPSLHFTENENVKVLVFDIFRLYQAYKLRKKYKRVCFDILYCVPHFTGSTILPEQDFRLKIVNTFLKKRFAEIYDKIFQEGNLYFFASKHYDIIQKEYNIRFSSPHDYLLPYLETREKYDEDSFRNVYHSDNFTILSAGRFEFPHKGYLLGLIKEYGKLKYKYPHLKLLIIGDGPDRDKVKLSIQDLPEDMRKDVIVRAPLSVDDLKQIMKTVNLNISVAGCASLGARMGLVTLPARHYVYDCEVYGFFPDSRFFTTDTKPGVPVNQYIEQVINMDEEEYIHYSKLAYHTFDDELYNARFPFVDHHITNYIPSIWDFLFVKSTYNIQRLKYLIERIK